MPELGIHDGQPDCENHECGNYLTVLRPHLLKRFRNNEGRPAQPNTRLFARGCDKSDTAVLGPHRHFNLAGATREPLLGGEFQRENGNVVLLPIGLGRSRDFICREPGQI